MSYISPLGTCISICEGKLPAAILLHQMLYQCNYAIKIGERYWLARSRKYWEQNTGLSKKQIRTALEYLLEKKLIICHYYKSKYIPCSHYRINNILKSLCPELVEGSSETLFYGNSIHFWNKHKAGATIENFDLLHTCLFNHWQFANQIDDLVPPSDNKDSVNN